jgi:hypothetical protein
MMKRMLSGLAVVGMMTALATDVLRASDPIGVYAIVDKVVVEPSSGPPQRIQIWGAFALAQPENPDDYGAAQRGYLYFSCPQGQAEVCRREWSDVQSVAGKSIGIGFGARRLDNGRVRKADEKPASPDEYPIKMGVVRVTGRQGQNETVAKLKTAVRER